MKITGGSSYIKFDMGDGHVVIAEGEMLIGKRFVVGRKSMTHWEPPFEKEALSNSDIAKIEEQVLAESTDKTVQIIFE